MVVIIVVLGLGVKFCVVLSVPYVCYHDLTVKSFKQIVSTNRRTKIIPAKDINTNYQATILQKIKARIMGKEQHCCFCNQMLLFLQSGSTCKQGCNFKHMQQVISETTQLSRKRINKMCRKQI